jgi:hypothetical protein
MRTAQNTSRQSRLDAATGGLRPDSCVTGHKPDILSPVLVVRPMKPGINTTECERMGRWDADRGGKCGYEGLKFMDGAGPYRRRPKPGPAPSSTIPQLYHHCEEHNGCKQSTAGPTSLLDCRILQSRNNTCPLKAHLQAHFPGRLAIAYRRPLLTAH